MFISKRLLLKLGALLWLSGCEATQSIGVKAVSFFRPNDQQAVSTVSTATSVAKTQLIKWPVDTAIIPPPAIYQATSDNCKPTADLPSSNSGNVSALPNCGNKFKVGIPQVDQLAQKQATPTLCWAACTQALLRQQSIRVEQADLAKQFVPDNGESNVDQSAGLGIVMRALNPDLEPQLEQRGALPIDLLPVTSDQLLAELMAGRLCIVGLVEQQGDGEGHACIVCGSTFAVLKPSALSMLSTTVLTNSNISLNGNQPVRQVSQNCSYGLYSVELFDPMSGEHMTLDAQHFCDQAVFITSHQISRGVLLSALQQPSSGTLARNGSAKRFTIKSKTQSQTGQSITAGFNPKPANNKTSADSAKDKDKQKQ
jgi:hypothetical protein